MQVYTTYFRRIFLGLLLRPLVLGWKIFSEMKEHKVVQWTKRRGCYVDEKKNTAHISVCYNNEIYEPSLAIRINV